jgi:hypothetical protein
MRNNLLASIVAASIVAACATLPKNVVRKTDTYIAEVLSALQRQEAAADALFAAADQAHADGNVELCAEYLRPALTIEAHARAQAYRALYLAGLPYPEGSGGIPDLPARQPDPGPSEAVDYAREIHDFCEVYP